LVGKDSLGIGRVGLGRPKPFGQCFPSPLHSFRAAGFPTRLEAWCFTQCPSVPHVWHWFIPRLASRICPGVPIPFRGHRLTAPTICLTHHTHRPLAQRGLSCPHLQTLLRPDAPVWRAPRSLLFVIPRGLCSRELHASPSLLFFGLLYQHAATSTPSAGPVPLMVHPWVIRAFAQMLQVRLFRLTLLTGFREGMISGRQYSRHVAAC